jgi:hypothetical protein
MTTTIRDMPKLHSPFVREHVDGEYVVIDKIADGYEWVFDDPNVVAVEKLHGTNVSINIQDGVITGIWNRTTRIPFFNRGKEFIIDGIREAYSRKYTEFLPDGQHFGECIGPKINGNPYQIDKCVWVPFARLAERHCYRSWGKYPKTFGAINEWFEDLMPLYGRNNGTTFVEGVVFTHPDGRMAKLRRDMYPWYTGRRHG